MRWAENVASMGEMANVYRLLVRKPEGMKPHRKPRRRREDNIKMDFIEIGLETGLWWRAFLNTVMTFEFNKRRRKFWLVG
jgi:hypothetical protein